LHIDEQKLKPFAENKKKPSFYQKKKGKTNIWQKHKNLEKKKFKVS